MAKKKKKLNVRKLFVFILFLYLFFAFFYTLIKMPIKNIIITGNNLVKDYEIIEAADIKDYPSILTLKTRKIKKELESMPLIKTAEVKRNLKFQLKINITENKIVCLYKSTDKYLLDDGSSLDNNKTYEGIPTLINYTPEDVLKEFLSGLGTLDYGTIGGISEISYSPTTNEKNETIDSTRFILKMNDGITVYVNTAKINLLKQYQKIYASLEDKKGILHLDSGGYLEVK